MSRLADRVVAESAREHSRNHRAQARRCRQAYPSVVGEARKRLHQLASAHDEAADLFEALLHD